jgi:hypothetical protein
VDATGTAHSKQGLLVQANFSVSKGPSATKEISNNIEKFDQKIQVIILTDCISLNKFQQLS